MPAGYSSWCKICNSRHRAEVERWIKEEGLSFREASRRLEELGEHVVFSEKSRSELISNLVVLIQQKKLLLPASWTALRDELRYFRNVKRGTKVKKEVTCPVCGAKLTVAGRRQ